MKKFLIITASLVMLLSGCAKTDTPQDKKVYTVGSASVTSVTGSAADNALAKDGKVEVTTTYALVVLDSDKKFVYVSIDSAQNSGTFDATGTLVKAEVAPTKKEKGPAYGMAGNSGINKEWNEQIASFEEYLIGKDLAAVTGLVVDKGYLADSEDLKSSVTMAVSDFITVIEKAVTNAVEVKDVVSAGVASTTELNATSATTGTGKIEVEVTTSSVALDSEGKVAYVRFDTAQNQGTFDDKGAILEAKVQPTKIEKGDDYGLINASGIGKNWYQQIAALETWMTGKTVDEVKGLPVTDDHITDGEDLKSSVTISVGIYQTAFNKAVENKLDIK